MWNVLMRGGAHLYLSTLIILLLIVLMLTKALRSGRLGRLDRRFLVHLGLYAGAIALSGLVNAVWYHEAVWTVSNYALYLAVVLYFSTHPTDIYRIAGLKVASIAIVLLFVILNLSGFDIMGEQIVNAASTTIRIGAIFGHPAYMGYYAACVGVLLYVMVLQCGKPIYIAGLMMSCIVVIASQTRGAMLAFMVAIFLVNLYRRWYLNLLLLPAGAAFAGIQAISGRFLYRMNDPTFDYTSGRIFIWKTTLGDIARRGRYVTGNSLESYRQLVGLDIGRMASFDTYEFLHNDYLLVLYEVGVVGLIVYIAMHLYLAVLAIRGLGKGREPDHKIMALGLAGILIIILIGHFLDNVNYMRDVLLNFFMLTGLFLGRETQFAREREGRAASSTSGTQ
jgi:O-antigen ligase